MGKTIEEIRDSLAFKKELADLIVKHRIHIQSQVPPEFLSEIMYELVYETYIRQVKEFWEFFDQMVKEQEVMNSVLAKEEEIWSKIRQQLVTFQL